MEINRYYRMREDQVPSLLKRATAKNNEAISKSVFSIIDQVRKRGDDALLELTKTFDSVTLSSLFYPPEAIKEEGELLDDSLKEAIGIAAKNITTFHQSQKINHQTIEVSPGVYCWQKSVPVEKVGLYIPGGTAPLFSTLLMLAIPAKLAGCSEIIVATPPQKDGRVDPAILYAASLVGIDKILRVGGAQSIAAMAAGTESVPKVDKIFGPGNAFVTEAKQQVTSLGCAIDMPAGPSEVMVVIDKTSDPAFAAADMLSQNEHGNDSQSILIVIADDEHKGKEIADSVEQQMEIQLQSLSRKEYIQSSLGHSHIVVTCSNEEALSIINAYAPEHLIIHTQDFSALESRIVNAGSVFLGEYSPESAGDYASGTNHTLPTSGFARSYSGISLLSFTKTISFQRLTSSGLKQLGPTIVEMAQYESLDAHAKAVIIRLDRLGE